MNIVIAINTLVFLFLGAVWERDSAFDALLKTALWLLFACNAIAMMNASGYVVRVP